MSPASCNAWRNDDDNDDDDDGDDDDGDADCDDDGDDDGDDDYDDGDGEKKLQGLEDPETKPQPHRAPHLVFRFKK